MKTKHQEGRNKDGQVQMSVLDNYSLGQRLQEVIPLAESVDIASAWATTQTKTFKDLVARVKAEEKRENLFCV